MLGLGDTALGRGGERVVTLKVGDVVVLVRRARRGQVWDVVAVHLEGNGDCD